MNLFTDLFLAWRYFKPKRNAISVITVISVIGVMLGVSVLIIVLAVMAGFTDEFKKKILETSAHIQIESKYQGFILNPDEVIKEVENAGAKGAPIIKKHVLIQRGEKFIPRMVIGIDPARKTESINVSKVIKYGQKNVLKDGKFHLRKGEVLISTVMGRELGLVLGDKLILHSPSKISKMIQVDKDGQIKAKNINKVYLPTELSIAGIFSFGKYDFDKNIVFMNISAADELFDMPWGSASLIYVRTKDPFNLQKELKTLQEKFPNMFVYSWKELNSQFLGVLEVEKNMQFFLLIFIVLVAAFSIANTLITVVVQKTREIGLLKALGATDYTILRIFILQGFLVGFLGTIFGVVSALTILAWRNQILNFIRMLSGQELFPKEFYLFSQLPAAIHYGDLILIAILSMVICTLGGLLPAWRAARLNPAESLRYE